MRPSRVPVCAAMLLILLLAPQGSLKAQESPSKSVFRVLVMACENQPYCYEASAGTGFFISPDGTALTNSHTVYAVRANRKTYQLLAIVGQEIYGARLICANQLAYDPMKSRVVHMGRDVAEIRLTPPPALFDQLTYGGVPYARAHMGRLPAFPALTLGSDPAVGDPVRILGFGSLPNSPLPYGWSAQGTVLDLGQASDGTPLFRITFTRGSEPGHSGSPVLNAQDQVVGIFTWQKASDKTQGMAISRSALDPACAP